MAGCIYKLSTPQAEVGGAQVPGHLGYIASSRMAWATQEDCGSKKKKKNKYPDYTYYKIYIIKVLCQGHLLILFE